MLLLPRRRLDQCSSLGLNTCVRLIFLFPNIPVVKHIDGITNFRGDASARLANTRHPQHSLMDPAALKTLSEEALFRLRTAVDAAKPGVTDVSIRVDISDHEWNRLTRPLPDQHDYFEKVMDIVRGISTDVVEFIQSFDAFKHPRSVRAAQNSSDLHSFLVVCEHARDDDSMDSYDVNIIKNRAEKLLAERDKEHGFSCEVVRLTHLYTGSFKLPRGLPEGIRLSIPVTDSFPSTAFLYLDPPQAKSTQVAVKGRKRKLKDAPTRD